MADRPYGHSLLPPATSAWVSALFVVSFVLVLACMAIMYQHRADRFVRRKSYPLFLLSSVGILLVYVSQVVYLWWYWEAVQGSGAIWWTGQSLYYVGFVLTFWTMMIRSWRIVCIFSATPDLVISWPPVIKPRLGPRAGRWTWNLVTWRWNNVFTQRKRAEAWAFTRVAMLTLPAFFITCVLFPSGLTDMAEQLWTWYDFAAIAMFLAVALRLVSIRKLVTLDELVESRMLMWFSVAAIQYFIIDNFLWFLVIRPLSDTDPHHQLKFWAFEVYQVVSFDILFCCTTGWVAWVCLRNPAVASRTATTSTSASQNTVNPLMRSTGYDVSTNSVSSNNAHSTGPLASDGPKHSSSEAQV